MFGPQNLAFMRSFGLKMRQKQVREIFRKVCQTCFCTMLAGTDAGMGVRGHVRVWGGILLFSPTVWVGSGGGEEGHTGTYTRMLHLPFNDLPLKKCPKLRTPPLPCKHLYSPHPLFSYNSHPLVVFSGVRRVGNLAPSSYRVDAAPRLDFAAFLSWEFAVDFRCDFGGVLRGNTIRGNRPERF